MIKHYKKILVLALIAMGVVLAAAADAQCQYHNVYGYAWSENIGWISMSCENSGAEHWMLVDDRIPDDSGSYVYNGSNIWQEDVYELSDPSLSTGTVLGIQARGRVGGDYQIGIRFGAQTLLGPVSSFSDSWQNISAAYAWTNLFPGWTQAQVTNMQLIVRVKQYSVGGQGKASQVYLYISGTGGTEYLWPNGDAQIGIANPSAGGGVPNYGLDVDESTGALSGYAWSENIGWIQFDPPVGGPSYSACLDLPGAGQSCDGVGDYTVSGWARALAPVGQPPSVTGGWDGWIKMSGTWVDGVTLNTSPSPSEFEGWAWGDMVVGWMSFNASNCDSDGDGVTDQGNYSNCPVGDPISDYKVMTDLVINPPPLAINLNRTEGNYCNCEIGQTTQCSGSKSQPPIHLNWTFDDPGDTQSAYQIQIDNSGPGFPSPEINKCVYDSTKISNPVPGVCEAGTIGPGPDYSYAPDLFFNTPSYYWKLKVWDSQGAESGWISAPASFSTDIRWPNTSFTPSLINPPAGTEVTFTDESKCYTAAGADYDCAEEPNPYGISVTYEWDFEYDGSFDPSDWTKGDTTHTYAVSGDYIVRLAVSGSMCPCVFPLTAALPLPTWKEIAPF